MNVRGFALVSLCLVPVLVGCSSGSQPAAGPTTTIRPVGAPSTGAGSPVPKGHLSFREVKAQYLWPAQPVTPSSLATAPKPYPGCAKLIAQSPPDVPSSPRVVRPDLDSKSCYVLGPVLLNGDNVGDASVIYDSTSSQWAINLRFTNDDFITKIARPLVNKQVAIVLNGVVQSAPTINAGITGRDVEITGSYTKRDAIAVAASILGKSPAAVTVDTSG